jgi:hypothetical protein
MFTEAETANLDALHVNPGDKGRTWQMAAMPIARELPLPPYRQWANVVSLLTPTEKPCLLGLSAMLKEGAEGPIDATGCTNTFGTHLRHLQPRGHHPNHTTNG